MREPESKVIKAFGVGARGTVNDSDLKVNRLEEAYSMDFKCGKCKGWFWWYELIGVSGGQKDPNTTTMPTPRPGCV